MAALAWLIARLKRAKLIVQTHGIEAWSRPSRLCQAAIDAADVVICPSRYTRCRVLGWSGVAPERIVLLPNTVDEAFTPGDGSALREAWGLQGKRVLLTVARMDSRERYKGHDRVIAAIPQLVGKGHDVIYVVLGEGDDQPRLVALANKSGVGDRVWFMGAVGRQTIIDAYRAADLFVMPSTGEGFGIAFLEAMASGTPAIGLAVAGARDALADGELGIAVTEDGFPCGYRAGTERREARPRGSRLRHSRSLRSQTLCSLRADDDKFGLWRLPEPGKGHRGFHGGRRMRCKAAQLICHGPRYPEPALRPKGSRPKLSSARTER